MPTPATDAITANATFCATLVDSWVTAGLSAAFIAPGSRSTPLALALAERAEPEGLAVHLFHDERAASFAALGHGLATGTPAVVLCSSGTAGTHFHGAVVEADLSSVPMLVCTADRPPELWDRGAPQTIDQTDLYGDAVSGFIEPGPPEDTDPGLWRELADLAYRTAKGSTAQGSTAQGSAHGEAVDARPGPVHLNLSFRDPLTGIAGELPPNDPAEPESVSETVAPSAIAELASLLTGVGVIIAGRGQSDPAEVLELADRLQWPVISDHRSGCRDSRSIHYFDAILRSDAVRAGAAGFERPTMMLRLGEIVSSKAVSQWISGCSAEGTTVIAGQPWGRFIDPEDVADHCVDEHGLVAALLDHVSTNPDPKAAENLAAWSVADTAAASAVATVLGSPGLESAGPNNDVAVARQVVASVPTGGALVVSSSMPVRDVEWFGGPRTDISVYSNRGANGIDGVISTAIGVASTGVPTICYIGDVAFLHDSTALVGLAKRPIDLTIVVTDNDGGAIFSFLPQHRLLDHERYEMLFGTPHGTDLAMLAAAHGIQAKNPAGDWSPHGVQLVLVATDRATNLQLHHELIEAVETAATL